MSEQRITRDELENKFRVLQADIQGRVENKRQSVIAAGGAVVTVVMLIAYLLGRRSGRKRAGRVEFRRF